MASNVLTPRLSVTQFIDGGVLKIRKTVVLEFGTRAEAGDWMRTNGTIAAVNRVATGFQIRLSTVCPAEAIGSLGLPAATLERLYVELADRLVVIAPDHDGPRDGVVRDVIDDDTAPDRKSLWSDVLRRTAVSSVLTAGTVATLSAAALAVTPSETVPSLMGMVPWIALALLAFLAIAVGIAVAATRDVGRSAFPRRLKYVVPLLGLITTAAVASSVASSAAVPELHIIGIAGGILANLATFARIADDEAQVLRRFDPTYSTSWLLDYVCAHQWRWGNWVFGLAAAFIGGAAVHNGGDGMLASFEALAIAAGVRAVAGWLRKPR